MKHTEQELAYILYTAARKTFGTQHPLTQSLQRVNSNDNPMLEDHYADAFEHIASQLSSEGELLFKRSVRAEMAIQALRHKARSITITLDNR